MKITGYKGFNYNFQCRGFQFEVGKEYTVNGKLAMCQNGFHFCRKPLNVFGFYGPTERFALIEATDRIIHEGIKSVCSKIKIIKELTLQELVGEVSVEHVMTKTRCRLRIMNTGNCSGVMNTEDYSVATNTGYRSVATNTGDYSVATNTGIRSAVMNVGDRSAATNAGDYSVAMNTGNYSVAMNTGGDSVATNTGEGSAATNTGYRSVAMNTGNDSVATNTGDYSVATNTGGDSVAIVEKPNSIAIVTGYRSKASGVRGAWLFLTERNKGNQIINAKAIRVDGKKIKEKVFYTLYKGKVIPITD